MTTTTVAKKIYISSSAGDSNEDIYSNWGGGCVCVIYDDDIFVGFGVDFCCIIFCKNNLMIVVIKHFQYLVGILLA